MNQTTSVEEQLGLAQIVRRQESMMSERDRGEAYERELAEFVQSVRESREETRLHGPVPPEELDRMVEEAIDEGARHHEEDQKAKRRVQRH